jgi:hypothetical protein
MADAAADVKSDEKLVYAPSAPPAVPRKKKARKCTHIRTWYIGTHAYRAICCAAALERDFGVLLSLVRRARDHLQGRTPPDGRVRGPEIVCDDAWYDGSVEPAEVKIPGVPDGLIAWRRGRNIVNNDCDVIGYNVDMVVDIKVLHIRYKDIHRRMTAFDNWGDANGFAVVRLELEKCQFQDNTYADKNERFQGLCFSFRA